MSPPGKVGHQDLVAEVQLRLVKDPPPARPTAASVERPSKFESESRGSRRVSRSRARMHVECAADNLGDQVFWRVEDTLIGGSRVG